MRKKPNGILPKTMKFYYRKMNIYQNNESF